MAGYADMGMTAVNSGKRRMSAGSNITGLRTKVFLEGQEE